MTENTSLCKWKIFWCLQYSLGADGKRLHMALAVFMKSWYITGENKGSDDRERIAEDAVLPCAFDFMEFVLSEEFELYLLLLLLLVLPVTRKKLFRRSLTIRDKALCCVCDPKRPYSRWPLQHRNPPVLKESWLPLCHHPAYPLQ